MQTQIENPNGVIGNVLSFEQMNFLPEYSEELKSVALNNESGLILVTGEVGVGKTTAIENLLREIEKSQPDRFIIQVCDLIEVTSETRFQIALKEAGTEDELKDIRRETWDNVMNKFNTDIIVWQSLQKRSSDMQKAISAVVSGKLVIAEICGSANDIVIDLFKDTSLAFMQKHFLLAVDMGDLSFSANHSPFRENVLILRPEEMEFRQGIIKF